MNRVLGMVALLLISFATWVSACHAQNDLSLGNFQLERPRIAQLEPQQAPASLGQQQPFSPPPMSHSGADVAKSLLLGIEGLTCPAPPEVIMQHSPNFWDRFPPPEFTPYPPPGATQIEKIAGRDIFQTPGGVCPRGTFGVSSFHLGESGELEYQLSRSSTSGWSLAGGLKSKIPNAPATEASITGGYHRESSESESLSTRRQAEYSMEIASACVGMTKELRDQMDAQDYSRPLGDFLNQSQEEHRYHRYDQQERDWLRRQAAWDAAQSSPQTYNTIQNLSTVPGVDFSPANSSDNGSVYSGLPTWGGNN